MAYCTEYDTRQQALSFGGSKNAKLITLLSKINLEFPFPATNHLFDAIVLYFL